MSARDDDTRIDVTSGVDTDRDGRGDTLPLPSARELLLAVDTDRDGFADLIIEIGPDAVVYSIPLTAGLTDSLADACYANPLEFTDPSRW
ncbi:MAG TPA: hypothetical protein VIQ30_04100 [Pseudonocardia sp.]|jgi:hypothetical protein